MLSQKTFIIFFVLIIFIFIFCTIFLSKIPQINENFSNDSNSDEILEKNLKLVSDFSNGKIKFNTIDEPNKNITKFQCFYDISIFPDLEKINYSSIKDELITHLDNNNNNWMEWPEYDLWKQDDKRTSWKIIPIISFGNWSKKNSKLFPKTTLELLKIDGLVSAGFSKLGPNTTLKLHKGWGNLSNNVLRCHLGLIVPENKCKIFVMGNTNDEMYQKENKWIIFDDSLYHSASNEDNEKDRIVLLLDIKRPDHIEKGNSDVENSDELNKFIDEFNK